MRAGATSQLLVQTFRIDGPWPLQFMILPALTKTGLASLLVGTVTVASMLLLAGFAGLYVVSQVPALVLSHEPGSLWRGLRDQLLLAIVLLCLVYFLVHRPALEAVCWLLFNCLMAVIRGLLLVLQPVPVRDREGI